MASHHETDSEEQRDRSRGFSGSRTRRRKREAGSEAASSETASRGGEQFTDHARVGPRRASWPNDQTHTLRRRDARDGGRSVRSDDESADGTGIPVASPDSEYEREAERVARQATAEGYGVTDADSAGEEFSGLSPQVQRSTTATDDSVGEAPESVREVVNSPGQSLDSGVRRRMESTMGENFGDVAVHTGSTAAQSTDDVNARAYTVGSDVVFDSGEYAPGTPEGDRVIAHELAHVAQQSRGTPRVQRQGGGYTQMTAEHSTDEFVAQKYQKIWAEVNSAVRKALDVSGKPEQGKIPVRLFGKALYISQFKLDMYKRKKEAVKQHIPTDVEQNWVTADTTAAERDLIEHQRGKFQKKVKNEAKDTTGRDIDATLAAIANEITDEVVTEKRVREEFEKDPERRGSIFKSDTARKRISDQLQREVTQKAQDIDGITAEINRRLDPDDIVNRSIETTEASAVDAFNTIRSYLDGLDRGESTSLSLSITITTPDSPVSVSLSGSLSAGRDPEGSVSLDGMIKFGLNADIDVASAGFNVRKLVRSGGDTPKQATMALSYAFYRHYVGLGTEWLADRLWGAGQDGSGDYRRKAQRWAAAVESRLSEESFGMVGYGADVNAGAGGGVGVAELSGKVQQTADTFELYDRKSLRDRLTSRDEHGNAVTHAGEVVKDSDDRRRLEKRGKSLRDVQEYNTTATFTTSVGGPGASATLSLSAGYKYNTGEQAHSFTLTGAVKTGELAGIAGSLADKLYETARGMRQSADTGSGSTGGTSTVEFDKRKLGELLSSGAASALSQSTTVSGGGSGGIGLSLERTVSPSGAATTFKLFRTSGENFTLTMGYVNLSVSVSKNRIVGLWERQDGSQWQRKF